MSDKYANEVNRAPLPTESTLRSEKFARLLAAVSGDCKVMSQPGYGLVPLIERGDTHSPAVLELLQAYLQPMLDAGADTLVHGCTHYPFLEDAIRDPLQLVRRKTS